MNDAAPKTYDLVAPLDPPRPRTSRSTKLTVLVLAVVVCGTPSAAFYWFHQHFRVFEIPAASMEPTIRRGDRILVDMRYFHNHPPAHGEIVVFDRNEMFLVKRVAALPGDTIEGRAGAIYLNGNAVAELYVQHVDEKGHSDFREDFGPVTLKAGECFVMGDNRGNSLDSRYPAVGPVSLTTIIGRPLFVLSSRKRDRAWERIK